MPRTDSPRARRNRARIAQAAARLIAEHGLNDWQAAKRKACRHLGLPDHEALPGNEEVEQALRDYNTLFQGMAQVASLRAQRRDALGWMEKLSQWKPLLTGAVAAGWATEYSEVRLGLEAEDAKSVELSLINAGIAYEAVRAHSGDGGWRGDRRGTADPITASRAARPGRSRLAGRSMTAATLPRPERNRSGSRRH